MSDEQQHGSAIPGILVSSGVGGLAGLGANKAAKSHVEKVSKAAPISEAEFGQKLAAMQTKVWDAAADQKPFAGLSDSIKDGFGEKGVEAFKKYHEKLSQNPVTSREVGLQTFNAADKSFETLVSEHATLVSKHKNLPAPSKWARATEGVAKQAAKRPYSAVATGAIAGLAAYEVLKPKHTERLAAREASPAEGRAPG